MLKSRMFKSGIAVAAAGLLLTACANASHGAKTALGPAPAGAMKGCADQGCGNSDPGHRQYYDEKFARYYYYDGAGGRYNWEDGTPRD
jgi:hypothetical protein